MALRFDEGGVEGGDLGESFDNAGDGEEARSRGVAPREIRRRAVN
jgi:hypothetical protein